METIAEKCIAVALKNEGGYVNHKSDPGGETNYGISDRADGTIDGEYRGIDISDMTKEQAIEIYYKNYWAPMHLNLIEDDELKLHLFDMGVNSGPRTAVRLMQKHLGLMHDGVIGKQTALAVNGKFTAEDYKDLRRARYDYIITRNPKLAVFRKGWYNRVKHTTLE